jgi:hypothetical protein
MMDNYTNVRKYTTLMLTRRNYSIGQFTDVDENGVSGKKPRLYVTKPNGEQAVVFFIHKRSKTDKVTINVVKVIISMAQSISHIIIVHDTVLTSDAKQNVTKDDETSIHQFETFTFDELSYDLLEVIKCTHPITFLENTPYEANKLPILLSTDQLARYLRIRHGDIVKGMFGDDIITIRRCVSL